MNNLLDPKPIGQEISFSVCRRGLWAEDPDCYLSWESLVKKLLVQFQFFFEYLGPESPGRKYLERAQQAKYKNIDGSEIQLPATDPFQEEKKVHLQLFFADGTKPTSYKFADGCNGDFHFCAIEPNNLLAFVPRNEFAPLIFPTNQNFYEESVNKTFLNDKKYEKRPDFPIYHPFHRETFTARYFKKALKIPAGLLSINFSCPDSAETVEAVRALNFSLALLYATCLLESAYIDLFGKHREPLKMIRRIEQNWRLGSGKVARGLNSYHLFILQFLLRLSHLSGYGLAAALFRLKNGAHSYNPGHGTWQIGGDNEHTPYKIYLGKQIGILVNSWCKKILEAKTPAEKNSLKQQINLAVKLGELFGLGYQVDPKVSKAYSFDQPLDFRPGFASGDDFSQVNFVAKYNPESPLWRVYYLYSRKMWKMGRENQQIFGAFGEAWELNKNHPRAVQYSIIHEYQLKFLLDNIRFLESSAKSAAERKKLKQSQKKLLGTINQARGQFILASLAQ